MRPVLLLGPDLATMDLSVLRSMVGNLYLLFIQAFHANIAVANVFPGVVASTVYLKSDASFIGMS